MTMVREPPVHGSRSSLPTTLQTSCFLVVSSATLLPASPLHDGCLRILIKKRLLLIHKILVMDMLG